MTRITRNYTPIEPSSLRSKDGKRPWLEASRNPGDRILVFVLAVPIWLLFGWLAYTLHEAPPETNWAAWLFELFIFELVSLVFMLASLAIVWAVAAPKAVPRLIESVARRTAIGCSVFGLIVTAIIIAAVFWGPR